MMARRLVAALLAALLTGGVAQAEIELDPAVHPEHYRVRINDVSVAGDTLAYLANDGTIYVSAADLDAWRLKRPRESAFTREAQQYYGLQTDLHLAAAVDRLTKTLEIVASRFAFVGEKTVAQPKLTPGAGAYLNYRLAREFGDYDLFVANPAGVFEMRYLSTAGEAGLEFHRARTRWFHLDPQGHYVVQLGDWATEGDNLRSSIPFAGLHIASDFSGDPTYVSHARPSVSGIATSPSLVEVYVDNILQLRQEVLEGPFTIGDLPAEAAFSDIVLVLTDASGRKTVQTVRPTIDPSFLGAGLTTFAVDAGFAHELRDLPGSYYRGSVFSGSLRHGLTNQITGTVALDSTVGKRFGDIGFDVQLGEGQLTSVRYGVGNGRSASTFAYSLTRGNLRFSESLELNSEQQEPLFNLDVFNVVARLREATSLSVDVSRALALSLSLDRARENTGYDASMLSAGMRYRSGPWSFDARPLYDVIQHRFSGALTVTRDLNSAQRLTQRTNVASRTSGALEYSKDRTDPNDPLQYDAQVSVGRGQDQTLSVNDETPAFTASLRVQQLNGVSLVEPEINGALAFAGNHIYALPTVSESSTFGVLHLPGLSNVPVTVNSQPAGATDRSGNLLLRDLAPFRENLIKVSTTDLPLGTTILNPERVSPYQQTPVSLTVPVLARGGFVIHVTDAAGKPLDAATTLRSAAGGEFPVGYDGRVYVSGIGAGTQRFTGMAGAAACSFDLDVPRDTSTVPDLGVVVCR